MNCIAKLTDQNKYKQKCYKLSKFYGRILKPIVYKQTFLLSKLNFEFKITKLWNKTSKWAAILYYWKQRF
jgi:hypothetical protein